MGRVLEGWEGCWKDGKGVEGWEGCGRMERVWKDGEWRRRVEGGAGGKGGRSRENLMVKVEALYKEESRGAWVPELA